MISQQSLESESELQVRSLPEESSEQYSYSELVEQHLELARKLAYSILSKWQAQIDQDDVESTISLALCQAAKRFSYEHETSFETFLYHYLRGRLIGTIEQSVNATRVMRAALNSSGTQRRVEFDISEEEEEHLTFQPDAFFSLQADTPEEVLLRTELIERFRKVYEQLDEANKEILSRIMYDGESPAAIAKDLGCTRRDVLNSRNSALRELKTLAIKAGLAPESCSAEKLSEETKRKEPQRKRRSKRVRRRRVLPSVDSRYSLHRKAS